MSDPPPQASKDRRCPVCESWIPAGSVCPQCRARVSGARPTHRMAWFLVGGAALLLVMLYLWVERLGGHPDGSTDVSSMQEGTPAVADGQPRPGQPVAVTFENERCVPWHVSASEEPPPGDRTYLVITSQVVDPGALVLSGFSAECGEKHPVVAIENLPRGKLAELVEKHHPAAVVAVGRSATMRVQEEAPGLPLFYTHVFDPVGAGLDDSGAVGVSPWIPIEPALRHVLAILPKNATLGVIHPPGWFEEIAGRAAVFLRKQDRQVRLYPVRSADELEAVLGRAAKEAKAWIVLPDRKVIDHVVFNRIQVLAQEHAIPIGVPDEEHVRRGALVGAGADSHRIGRQLCRLAGAGSRERLPAGSRVFCPEYSFGAIHQATLEKLGYILGPNEIQQAKLYKWH